MNQNTKQFLRTRVVTHALESYKKKKKEEKIDSNKIMIPTTTAVIVTYNRLELLKENINKVCSQKTTNLKHIFIVDNCSTDGTSKYLSTLEDSRITVFTLNENIGGAGGFNFGMKKFYKETNDELVWLMDDDTFPKEDALLKIQKFYTKVDHCSFIASNVRWNTFDGPVAQMNASPTPYKMFGKYLLPEYNAIEILNATFVSVVFPRRTLQKIGLPQKEYFIWGDDIEYTTRALKVGFGYQVIDSLVAHKTPSPSSPNVFEENNPERIWRYEYEYRNRVFTATRMDSKLRQLFLMMNRIDIMKMYFSKDPLKKKKIKVMKKGHRLAKKFKPIIERV